MKILTEKRKKKEKYSYLIAFNLKGVDQTMGSKKIKCSTPLLPRMPCNQPDWYGSLAGSASRRRPRQQPSYSS